MAGKLTVIIPCKDEETNIRGCLHSARKVADEIVLADSGSTDRTLEIVRGMSDVRIIERAYVNSGDFKNWAIPQATQSWVLILDADERIPDQLADEIRDLLQRDPEHDGYWLYRASFFMGHRIRFSGWQNDCVLRLFRRDLGVYTGDYDHAEVTISSGRVSRLKNRLLHYSYWTYHDYFQRMRRYSTYQATKWQEQRRRVSWTKLFFNLPLRFLQLYVLRLGFLDGLAGFQVCTLTAVYSFSKQACLWQLRYGRSREEANRDATDVWVTAKLPVNLAKSQQREDGSRDEAAREDVVARDATATDCVPTDGRCEENTVAASGVARLSTTALAPLVLRQVRFMERADAKIQRRGQMTVFVQRTTVPTAGMLEGDAAKPRIETPDIGNDDMSTMDRNEITHGG